MTKEERKPLHERKDRDDLTRKIEDQVPRMRNPDDWDPPKPPPPPPNRDGEGSGS